MKNVFLLSLLFLSPSVWSMGQQLIQLQSQQTTLHENFDLKSDRGNSISFGPGNGHFNSVWVGKKDDQFVLALQKNKDKFFFHMPNNPANFNDPVVSASADQTGQNLGVVRTISHYSVSPVYYDFERQSCNDCRQVCRRTRRGTECWTECRTGWQEVRVSKRDHNVAGSVQLTSASGSTAAHTNYQDRLVEILGRSIAGACW